MKGEFSKKLVPIGKAAEYLGVSIDTVRRWNEKGLLYSARPDGKKQIFFYRRACEDKVLSTTYYFGGNFKKT